MAKATGLLVWLLAVTIIHGKVVQTIKRETNQHKNIVERILEFLKDKRSVEIETPNYDGLMQREIRNVLRNLINEEETEMKQKRTFTNKLQLLERTMKGQQEEQSTNKKEQKNNNQKKKAKGKFKGTGHVFDQIEKIKPDSWYEQTLNSFTIGVNGSLHPINKPKISEGDDDEFVVGNGNSKDKDDIERNLKTMDTDPNRYWVNGTVPYIIDTSGFDETKTAKIEAAIAIFNSVSCVKWVPRDAEPDYIKFRSGTGCGSYVGRRGGEQKITLGTNCINTKLINHEMFHAIGGYHEMSRPDADRYVTLHTENIKDGKQSNFAPISGVDTYYPYDVSSILQYSLTCWSKNKQRTIDLNDWRLNFLVNSGTGLMYYDVAEINHYYQCEESCTEKLLCDNGGYQTENCTCHCPDPLEGELCQTPVTDETCGGVITITGEDEIEITSPNYPSNYDAGAVCTWLIQGVKDNIVRVTVQDMDISHNNQACYHWLEFRYNLLGQEGPKRCGTATSDEVWDASWDERMDRMILRFDSFTGSDKPTSRGFNLTVQSIGTGCVNHSCVHGSCFSPLNTDSYNCTCYPGFTGDNCTELSVDAEVGCTVEVGKFCMLAQEKDNDVFDWVQQTGEAPNFRIGSYTDVTGPAGAYQGFAYYMLPDYVSGMNATLYTKVDFPSVDRCLSFWYHMRSLYMNSMGTLNVYMESAATPQTLLFTRSYNQGKSWLYTQIDIPAVDGLKISFEGIQGTNWMCNMAIDDVKLTPGTCDNGALNIIVEPQYTSTSNMLLVTRGLPLPTKINTPYTVIIPHPLDRLM